MRILLLKEKSKQPKPLLVPSDVAILKEKGFEIYFEKGVGQFCEYSDNDYIAAGAVLDKHWKKNLSNYHLICTTGIISSSILRKLKPTQPIWSYSNLINESKFLYKLVKAKSTLVSLKSIKYKNKNSIFTVTEQLKGKYAGSLAGYKLAYSNKNNAGKLFGGIEEVNSTAFVIGGLNAGGKEIINQALSVGSDVFAFDYDQTAVDSIKANEYFGSMCAENKCSLSVFKYDFEKIFKMLEQADVIFLCPSSPNQNSANILNEKMVAKMKKGSLIVDLSSEYGFSSDTEYKYSKISSRTFNSMGINHFCIKDITALYPRTFAQVISKLNVEYLQKIPSTFNITSNEEIASGIIINEGNITNKEVATNLNLKYTKLSK